MDQELLKLILGIVIALFWTIRKMFESYLKYLESKIMFQHLEKQSQEIRINKTLEGDFDVFAKVHPMNEVVNLTKEISRSDVNDSKLLTRRKEE